MCLAAPLTPGHVISPIYVTSPRARPTSRRSLKSRPGHAPRVGARACFPPSSAPALCPDYAPAAIAPGLRARSRAGALTWAHPWPRRGPTPPWSRTIFVAHLRTVKPRPHGHAAPTFTVNPYTAPTPGPSFLLRHLRPIRYSVAPPLHRRPRP